MLAEHLILRMKSIGSIPLLAHEKANNYLRQQAAARGWDYFTIEDDTHKGSNSLTLVGFADQGSMRAGTDALGRICVSCNIFDEEFYTEIRRSFYGKQENQD